MQDGGNLLFVTTTAASTGKSALSKRTRSHVMRRSANLRRRNGSARRHNRGQIPNFLLTSSSLIEKTKISAPLIQSTDDTCSGVQTDNELEHDNVSSVTRENVSTISRNCASAKPLSTYHNSVCQGEESTSNSFRPTNNSSMLCHSLECFDQLISYPIKMTAHTRRLVFESKRST